MSDYLHLKSHFLTTDIYYHPSFNGTIVLKSADTPKINVRLSQCFDKEEDALHFEALLQSMFEYRDLSIHKYKNLVSHLSLNLYIGYCLSLVEYVEIVTILKPPGPPKRVNNE